MENQKVFKKCWAVKIAWIMILVIGIIFMSIDDGEGVLVVFGLIALFASLYNLWRLSTWKLILGEEGVTIKYGILNRRNEEIKYKKINNIKTNSFLGIGGISIFTGKDEPVVFKNLEKYSTVKKLISDKID